MTQELAIREVGDLSPRLVMTIDDMENQLRLLEEFKRRIMVPGVDFGEIPGTNKPSLLKPGAEKLVTAFGFTPTFENVSKVEDWENGFFAYHERCVLTSRHSGIVMASASGECNSRESRYRWRDAKPRCPACGKDLRRSKPRDGERGEPGWYCWNNPTRNAHGCGANYAAGEITGAVGRIENPEIADLVNTIIKMAQKRALVAAALIATGGSGTWSQDLEDLPDAGVDEDERPRRFVAPTRTQSEAAGQAARATTQSGRAPAKAGDAPATNRGRSVEEFRSRYAVLIEQATAKGIQLDPEEYGIGEDSNVTEISAKGIKLKKLLDDHDAEADIAMDVDEAETVEPEKEPTQASAF